MRGKDPKEEEYIKNDKKRTRAIFLKDFSCPSRHYLCSRLELMNVRYFDFSIYFN